MVAAWVITWYEEKYFGIVTSNNFWNRSVCHNFKRWADSSVGEEILRCTEKTCYRCNLLLYLSFHNIHGRLGMDSIFLDLKEEDKWEEPQLLLRKMKKDLFLQGLQTKDNYLFVIGLRDQLTKLAARTKRLSVIGTKKEVLGRWSLLIYFQVTRISCSPSLTIIFAFGRQMLKFLSSQVWLQKAAIIPVDVGAPPELGCYSLRSLMGLLTFGISWTSHTSGICNILLDLLEFLPWSSMKTTPVFWLWEVLEDPCTFFNFHSLSQGKLEMKIKLWTNFGIAKSKVLNTSMTALRRDLRNLSKRGLAWT